MHKLNYFLRECGQQHVGLVDLIIGCIWLMIGPVLGAAGLAFAVHEGSPYKIGLALGWFFIAWLSKDMVRAWPSELIRDARLSREWDEAQATELKRLKATRLENNEHPIRRW